MPALASEAWQSPASGRKKCELEREAGIILEVGLECSMSRRANCWDNSCVESFFATIKKELINRHAWPTETSVHNAMERYIQFYNARRRHSRLGSCSPIEYELARATDDFKMAA